MEKRFENGNILRSVVGDITQIPADAIVNAANSALRGGSGVDGAIHRAGGPSILEELDKIRARAGGCSVGKAVVTGAGKLPARFVFHTVGPVYREGRNAEAEMLAACYRSCLELAVKHDVSSVSFPSISTGTYRYPITEAAEIAVHEVSRHLAGNEGKLTEVIFVLFSKDDYETYSAVLKAVK